MSLDQHGTPDAGEPQQLHAGHEPVAPGRIVEGEVAPSRNGHASPNGAQYRHGDAPSLPTRIEDSELTYHRRVIAQAGQAQAIMQSWLGHLAEKYSLPQGSRIDDYGNILRGEAAQVGAPPQD
jgi:hypothetical protein